MTDNRDELMALANKFECCVPTEMKQPDGTLEAKYVVCYPERQHSIIVSALRASASAGVPGACRIMTPEEYAAFNIKGWHSVHKDYDGFGAVAVSYSAPTPVAVPVKPCAWVVKLKYGHDRWSGEMLTDVLPSETDTYQVIRPLYATPLAAGVRDILDRLYAVATSELRNTGCLMSNPPQSSAAWDIRNAISKEIAALASAGADKSSDGKCTYPACRCETSPPCPHYAHEPPVPAPSTDQRREEIAREASELLLILDGAQGVEVCTYDPMRCEHKRTHLSTEQIAVLSNVVAAALDGGDRG